MSLEGSSSSTSSNNSSEKMEIMKKANELLAQGKRNVVCGEMPKAINLFNEAVQMLAKEYGDLSRNCADAYFSYGSALLELGRMETNVLGVALEGVDVEAKDDENGCEQFEKPPTDGEEREKLRTEVYEAMAEGDREEAVKKSKHDGELGMKDTSEQDKDDPKMETLEPQDRKIEMKNDHDPDLSSKNTHKSNSEYENMETESDSKNHSTPIVIEAEKTTSNGFCKGEKEDTDRAVDLKESGLQKNSEDEQVNDVEMDCEHKDTDNTALENQTSNKDVAVVIKITEANGAVSDSKEPPNCEIDMKIDENASTAKGSKDEKVSEGKEIKCKSHADTEGDSRKTSKMDIQVESDKDTKAESDRDTNGDSGNETKGESDKETKGESGKETMGESDKETMGESDKGTKGESDKETKGESDKETKGESDMGTNGESDKGTNGESDKGTKGESDKRTKGESDKETKETMEAKESDKEINGESDKGAKEECGMDTKEESDKGIKRKSDVNTKGESEVANGISGTESKVKDETELDAKTNASDRSKNGQLKQLNKIETPEDTKEDKKDQSVSVISNKSDTNVVPIEDKDKKKDAVEESKGKDTERDSKPDKDAEEEEGDEEKDDGEEGDEGETAEEEEENQESTDNQEGTGTESQDDGEEKAEDVPNFQLAWEYLDLAKVIYLKSDTKDDQLKAAECHIKLGEVSMETEQHNIAAEDLQSALKIQEKYLEAEDRVIAETHYQLGLAYGLGKEFELSIEHYQKAISVIEAKIASLNKLVEEKEVDAENKENCEKDALQNYKDEIKELQEIIPEMRNKIEDTRIEAKDMEKFKEMAKEMLGLSGTSKGFGSPTKKTETGGGDVDENGAKKATDISSLVRKKRKPEEESAEPDVKKLKPNGDSEEKVNCTSGTVNGHSSEAEMTDVTSNTAST